MAQLGSLFNAQAAADALEDGEADAQLARGLLAWQVVVLLYLLLGDLVRVAPALCGGGRGGGWAAWAGGWVG